MKALFASVLTLAICCVAVVLNGAPTKRSAVEIDLIGAVMEDTGIDKGISVILGAGNGDLATVAKLLSTLGGRGFGFVVIFIKFCQRNPLL